MRIPRSTILILWFILSLVACQPMPPTPLPTATPSLFSITTTNMGGAGLPAGSSTSFALNLNYPPANPPQAVNWSVQNTPTGITTHLAGQTAPWTTRLIVTADSALAVG